MATASQATAAGLGEAPPRSAVALPVAGGTFLALVAFHPAVASPWFSMKATVLLVAGAAGLPLLVRLAVAGDRPARAAVALVAWSALSAAVAGTPLAWSGQFNLGTGAVFVAAVGGVWAIGRHLDPGARRLAGAGFLAGAVVNAAVAVLQGPMNLSRYSIFLFDGRSTGLMGNPVFLGAVCASGATLLGSRLARRSLPTLLTATLLAAAVQLSGSRITLGLLLAGALVSGRRAGPARAVALLAALGAGLVLGSVLRDERTDTSALARLSAEPAGGLAGRAENWKGGLEGALERPLVGHGPGLYTEAAGPHRTLALVREFPPDSVFQDAHNLVVEYAATTGLVGVALLAAWIGLSVLGAGRRDPDLLATAGVLFAFQLLEPQNVAVTPLGFLLLGAAGRPPPAAGGSGRGRVLGPALLATAALVPAAVLLAGDASLRVAVLDFDERAADRAVGLLRPWAAPLSVATRIHLFRYRTERREDELTAALASARRAVRREPGNPRRQVELGDVYGRLGRHEEAAEAFGRALVTNPWSVLALQGRAGALQVLGEEASAEGCRELAALAMGTTRSGSGISRSRSECLA